MGMERLVEVTLEIDAELKEQAEKVFAENGMTLEYIAKQLDTPASDSVGSVRP